MRVAELTIFLKKYTEKNKICYQSGAFVFEDPKNYLFDQIQKLPKSYKRISTHTKHFQTNNQDNIETYGLDIPDTKFSCENKVKIFRTLLYFKYSMINPISKRIKHFVYIKLEPHGVKKLHNFVLHTADYIVSRFNSTSFKAKRAEHVKFFKNMKKYAHEYETKNVTNYFCSLIPECKNSKQYEYTSYYRKGNEIYVPKMKYKYYL